MIFSIIKRLRKEKSLGRFCADRGFTLVEMLVYAAGVVLIIGVIVSMLYYAYSWYGFITSSSRSDQVGVALADRLVDDIRSGRDVTSIVTNNASGTMTISAMTAPGTLVNKTYSIQNYRITYREELGTVQYLTPKDVAVNRFVLNELDTGVSKAIRFTFDIVYTTRSGTSTTTYSGFGILRNTYQ